MIQMQHVSKSPVNSATRNHNFTPSSPETASKGVADKNLGTSGGRSSIVSYFFLIIAFIVNYINLWFIYW
jgi:predicted alpha/beta superfamily hydrolase